MFEGAVVPQKREFVVMSKLCSALLALTLLVAVIPRVAGQSPSGTNVGMLKCRLSPSIGFIVGSHQSMACRFTPTGPFPAEAYAGTMNTIGLDIGVTAAGTLAWGVFAPTAGPRPGGLAGTYVGASGDITAGVGVGANVLFGGSDRTIALQPVSVEGEVGMNLAVGVSGLTLVWVR
jgi:hypothetical protein